MTPGRRGWIVLAAAMLALGFTCYHVGARQEAQRWTYAHVAFETKGDRYAP